MPLAARYQNERSIHDALYSIILLYIYAMEAKFFSYKIDSITLQLINDNIKLSDAFNKKDLLNPLKELLKEQQFKIDPATVEYKIVNDQIMITGMAIKDEEPKSIGFMSGK